MIKQITVKELNDELSSDKIKLIDVREDDEVAICAVSRSIHVPMNKIPSSINQLDKNTQYAIMCHSGIRSHNVCFYLQNQGFNVVNVKGGIHEWALVIDKTMKTY
jgi:rhodanese-related sulfurtransferase|tara:strand:+ start:642 stop:956 length:315 start_codon:yes stop_codon:yes gene_type:complete